MLLTTKIKRAWKSATIWFNALILAAIPVLDYAKDSLPELERYLADSTYKALGLAVLVTNIVLRFKTSRSLADK